MIRVEIWNTACNRDREEKDLKRFAFPLGISVRSYLMLRLLVRLPGVDLEDPAVTRDGERYR